jgi:transposase
MGRRAAGELVLSDAERDALVALTRTGGTAKALALRARIILECAEGLANNVVAAKHHMATQTVGKWRTRYIEHRLDGLADAPRTGAPSSIDDSQVQAVITKTQESLSQGAPRLTSRTLAQEVGVSPATVLRIWRAYGLQQPQRRMVTELRSDSETRKKSRSIGGSHSTIGNSPPAPTASACETALSAAARTRRKTAISHTMEVSKKKNTEMIQRSATGRDAMETSKQVDLSTLPERKITRKPPAAA